jgi:hypothetical protein
VLGICLFIKLLNTFVILKHLKPLGYSLP